MGGSVNLGRIFGIQVRLHYSWFVIFMLVTFTLVYPNWTRPTSWAIGLATSLLFFASVLAHELAHSLVGRANGVPIKSITLFIFGGMAQMSKEATKASAELKMAAAGPGCSLAIGILFGLIWLFTKDAVPTVAEMVGWLALINVALAAFNLIPGFPLDGGRVLRALMWQFSGNYKRSTLVATRLGQGIAYTFMLGGVLIALIFRLWLDGLWLVFIGWFLNNAATMSYRQAQWREALHGLTAAQAMTSEYTAVPPGITISQLVQDYALPKGYRLFLVTEEDKFKGLLTLQNIRSVPQSKWDITLVEKIMTPANRLKTASPEKDALAIAEQMDEKETNQILVVSEGRVIGVVSWDNLMRFLRTRLELGIKNVSPRGKDG